MRDGGVSESVLRLNGITLRDPSSVPASIISESDAVSRGTTGKPDMLLVAKLKYVVLGFPTRSWDGVAWFVTLKPGFTIEAGQGPAGGTAPPPTIADYRFVILDARAGALIMGSTRGSVAR
jgi:hypothetical protein